MKRLLVVAALCAVWTVGANPTKVLSVQFADTTACIKAFAKLGEHCGIAMLGPMVAPQVANNPIAQFLGPMRENSSALLLGYIPEAALNTSNALDNLNYAILYPVRRTKAKFLADHPGSVETNGLIIARNPRGEKYYLAFSKDGRWVATARYEAFIGPALTEIDAAQQAMDGDVIRARVTELKGFSLAVRGTATPAHETNAVEQVQIDAVREFLQDIASIDIGLRVNDLGVDFRGRLVPRSGSGLSKMGRTVLGKGPLDFADAGAMGAQAGTEDAFLPGDERLDTDKVDEVLAKYGTSLLALGVDVSEKDRTLSVVLDIVPLVAGLKTNELFKTDAPKVKELCDELKAKARFMLEENGMKDVCLRAQFGVKGVKASVSPAERYARTLPEVADKPVFSASCYSFYELLKAWLPQLVDAGLLGADEQVQVLNPMSAALPPPGNGGTAGAMWREEEDICYQVRISKDEFKCCALASQIFAVLQPNGVLGDDDDCDDDTEDDFIEDDDDETSEDDED